MSGTWWLVRTSSCADYVGRPTYGIARRIESGVELVMYGTRRVISEDSARAILILIQKYEGVVPENHIIESPQKGSTKTG